MDRKTPLIIITGPTGSGKTGIVLKLARSYPIEIVSADSMQVYRHMDIATAKPSSAEKAMLPHHLIDVVNPDEEFNAEMFSSRASEKITDIMSRKSIPIVVGGTGLYIKALVYGLAPAPPRSAELRDYFRGLIGRKGSLHLWQILERSDPENADKINKNDTLRIVRSLEILFLTGKKPSSVYREHGFAEARYHARTLCLMPEREKLYADIDARVVHMVESGLIDETKKLLDMGFSTHVRSMQTLAYKHIVDYLEEKIGLESAIARIQRDTRNYAKRQVTWMRSNYDQSSFHTVDEALEIIPEWIAEDFNSGTAS